MMSLPLSLLPFGVGTQGSDDRLTVDGPLDGQRNEAVILGNVSLQDVGTQAEHTLEASPIQLHALERPTRNHRGRPGPIQQQCDLTKVIARSEPAHFSRFFALPRGKNNTKTKNGLTFVLAHSGRYSVPSAPHNLRRLASA